MDEQLIISLIREATWTGFVMALPILAVALVTGLAIGLLQALTSVQEMTLTFVPKLVAILAVLWATLGFMTHGLVGLFQQTIIPLVAAG